MFLDSIGIILRKNELLPNKIIVLDKIQGKIECVTSTPSLSAGSLITYNSKKQGQSHLLRDTTLVYIPFSLAQTDILFFHHVLELVYYFTNVGNCTQEVFNFLTFLYSTEHEKMSIQFKKIFLLKLLTSIGCVPEMSQTSMQSITYFNTLDIQQLMKTPITVADEKELDRWLWCCVWQHPYVNEFKTVHFLAENRAI